MKIDKTTKQNKNGLVSREDRQNKTTKQNKNGAEPWTETKQLKTKMG